MVCVATLGQGPLRQSTKHFGLKTYKSGAFPSKGPNLRCRLSSRPSHQSVGHFRLKAQSVRHFRLKAWSGLPDAPNKPSESHSGHIWRQAAQMLKMMPLRPLLAMSWARAPLTGPAGLWQVPFWPSRVVAGPCAFRLKGNRP